MKIVQATVRDAGACLESLKELNKEHVKVFTKKKVKEFIKTKPCVAMAVEDDNVLGVCIYDECSEGAEVFAIAVNSLHQSKGVGTKLLKWAETVAKFFGHTTMLVASYEFYGAKPFYLRNSYEVLLADEWGYIFIKDLER